MTIIQQPFELLTELNQWRLKPVLGVWPFQNHCSPVIATWVPGNPFVFITSCQLSHGHMFTICNFSCQILQKVNGKISRERCMSLG